MKQRRGTSGREVTVDTSKCALAKWSGAEDRCRWCDRALTGRARVWCSVACARSWSENHAWTAARLAALEASGYSCHECGSGLVLEVHHIKAPSGGRKRYGNGCWNHQDRLVVLCEVHHAALTRLERARPGPLQLRLPVAS